MISSSSGGEEGSYKALNNSPSIEVGSELLEGSAVRRTVDEVIEEGSFPGPY